MISWDEVVVIAHSWSSVSIPVGSKVSHQRTTLQTQNSQEIFCSRLTNRLAIGALADEASQRRSKNAWNIRLAGRSLEDQSQNWRGDRFAPHL